MLGALVTLIALQAVAEARSPAAAMVYTAGDLRGAPAVSADDGAQRGPRGLTGDEATVEPTPAAWSTILSSGEPIGVVGMSTSADKILYRHSLGGYWLIDRHTRAQQRVDFGFDGAPLSDIIAAAISGDGGTIVFLRQSAPNADMTLRIRRLDGSANWEVPLPNPGDGCSNSPYRGGLSLSDDGNVAWLPIRVCFADRLLALNIASVFDVHWRYIFAFSDNTEEVTADGKSFAVAWDFYRDRNGNGFQDSDEPYQTSLKVFPIEYTDNTANANSHILDWPPDRGASEFCRDLPDGSRARVDADGRRIVVTTRGPGLDPDTPVQTGS